MTKKICFIGGGLSGGGQERALSNWANEFALNGFEVVIICLFKTEIFFEIHPSIVIIWPDIDRKRTNKFIYAARLVPFIRKNVKHYKPNVVISVGDWFNSYVLIATRFLNLKTFITNRMGPNLYLGKFIEFFNSRIYKLADGLIVQTQRARQIFKNKYNLSNIYVIPNVLNPINVSSKSYEKNIVTIGRLSKEKGHQDLIHAFSKLQTIDWILHIVGDGPEMKNLLKIVKDLGIEEKVIFHGYQRDFLSILGNASIFVLPSYYEGFPNALLEAMSVPLACISSDCVAGPKEIIKDRENGLLYETGNINELYNKLQLLISDPELQVRLRNQAVNVREEYSSAKIFKLLKEVITEN
jgi:glycosyltransferase involved in cell wall biosynthesis